MEPQPEGQYLVLPPIPPTQALDQPHPPGGRYQKQKELRSLQLAEQRLPTQKIRQNEMAEKYVPDEGTR